MRGVTVGDKVEEINQQISTHTPHARRDGLRGEPLGGKPISTHTPHARRDHRRTLAEHVALTISTHTPHARRDLVHFLVRVSLHKFLLTRLMRGVTH